MDIIKIQKLEVFAYHGCKEEEKINGQKFYVDANLYCDAVRVAGTSDDLYDAINYSKVCKFIIKYITENRFNLIETVAEQTSRALLKEFPRIIEIDFVINKPNAPTSLSLENVAVSVRRKWSKAYLSIGSNIGNREENLNQAIDSLYDDDNCRVLAVSNFIETKPYTTIQQNDFLQGCLEIETLYSPRELLAKVNEIEKYISDGGVINNGSVYLDIDIVLYENEIVQQQDLMIPHIEMHKRSFVLEPLKQIAPYAIHPIYKKTVEQLLKELQPEDKCQGCGGCCMKE